jgi:hypothetical protein
VPTIFSPVFIGFSTFPAALEQLDSMALAPVQDPFIGTAFVFGLTIIARRFLLDSQAPTA